jgi:ATP phosphoribosyltransferase
VTGVLRVALPNKGRLAEPAVALMQSAGLEFELSTRRLSAPVANADVELLFVRTEDVAEYVADGLVELGITGADLMAEHGGALASLLPLGFGACSLVLAVPRERELDGGLAALAGARIATSFPRVTGRFLEREGIDAQVVEVRGAVEVTPQLGVADAVVDLVASGSTLRMNGLRPVATLLASEAVLVARDGEAPDGRVEALVDMLRSVIDARGREYMMMNAPATALERIRELIPGLSGPTVMPLADPSLIAVHSVVERSQLWRLVPALKQAGARDILVVPIEKVIR